MRYYTKHHFSKRPLNTDELYYLHTCQSRSLRICSAFSGGFLDPPPSCSAFSPCCAPCQRRRPARAGAGPNTGACPPEGQPQCGDPINPATGNVYETVTDFTTAGQNPLAIIRYYNSQVGAPGGSFRNWHWTYDRSLSIDPSEVDAFRAD